jgi:hypothetical protein
MPVYFTCSNYSDRQPPCFMPALLACMTQRNCRVNLPFAGIVVALLRLELSCIGGCMQFLVLPLLRVLFDK